MKALSTLGRSDDTRVRVVGSPHISGWSGTFRDALAMPALVVWCSRTMQVLGCHGWGRYGDAIHLGL